MTFENMLIMTGFLTGNILGNSTEYDESASADGYKEALEEALSKEYPGAEIKVSYQFGSGSLPHGLKTFVTVNDQEDENAEEDVDILCAKVWETFDWAVAA